MLGQVALGDAFRLGLGVGKDFSEAIKWYRKAAEKKYSDAQYELGNAYASGSGVPQDFFEAVKWWKLAAENDGWGHTEGYIASGYLLGRAYARGEGVAKNDAEAVKWLRKAAYLGNKERARYASEFLQKRRRFRG